MRKLFVIATLLILQGARAQTPDTLLYREALSRGFQVYNSAKEPSVALYSGVEHWGYPAFYEGMAYYQQPEWQKGYVQYEGELYRDVLLKYDMVKDQVVILHPDGITGINLFSPRVSQFSIGGSRFINVLPKDSNSLTGFCEVLVTGMFTLLAKKTKVIEEQDVYPGIIHRFVEKDAFYIGNGSSYAKADNEASSLRYLGGNRREIKRYLKRLGLTYKRDPQATLVALVTYYNQMHP